MGKTLWGILKDALKALLFWILAAIPLVYFFGYPGKMMAGFLGFILVLAFCLLRAAELLKWLLAVTGIDSRRPPPPLSRAAPAPNPSNAATSAGRPCPTCSGRSRITCYGCNGSGVRYEGAQMLSCYTCAGMRTLACTTCSAGGEVYW